MSDTLSGFLFWTDWDAIKVALLKCGRIRSDADAVDGWRAYEYTTEEEIPWVDTDATPPFTHPLMIRGGVNRVVILSSNYRICDYFVEKDLRPFIHASLRKADIAVHDLVLAFAEFRKTKNDAPTPIAATEDEQTPPNVEAANWQEFNQIYSLGHAFARSDAFGGHLQKLEFEGDDLATVSLFTDVIPFARFRNCGVRRKAIDERGYPSSYELLRLGKSGFLSFAVPASLRGKRDRLREVEALLRSLNRHGFIK